MQNDIDSSNRVVDRCSSNNWVEDRAMLERNSSIVVNRMWWLFSNKYES